MHSTDKVSTFHFPKLTCCTNLMTCNLEESENEETIVIWVSILKQCIGRNMVTLCGSCHSLSPKSMDRIARMGRMKEEEPHVKYKPRMSYSAVPFARLHLNACILWQSIKPSLVFLIRKRLHAIA